MRNPGHFSISSWLLRFTCISAQTNLLNTFAFQCWMYHLLSDVTQTLTYGICQKHHPKPLKSWWNVIEALVWEKQSIFFYLKLTRLPYTNIYIYIFTIMKLQIILPKYIWWSTSPHLITHISLWTHCNENIFWKHWLFWFSY